MVLRKVLRQGVLIAMSAFLTAGAAQAAQLTVKEARASSTLPEKLGVVYTPNQAIDGRLGTFWVEGEAAAGLGEWIEFNFGEEVPLDRIVFYSGNWDSRDFYQRHNRLKSVQVKFSNGSSEKFDLQDKMERQTMALAKPVKTRFVRIVLKEVYPGTTFNDTCLSEIQFFNDQPGQVVHDVKAKASSALPADRDATYLATNLLDGIQDTQWCEGKKDAGVGEMLTLTLSSPTALKELRLLNGVAVTEETYKKNNRVTKLRIDLGGGDVREVPVADTFGSFQSIPLEGAKPTANVKLTVLETAAGTSFNDTCLSELQLIRAQ